MTSQAQLLIALSLTTGACAIDADLESVEQHAASSSVLLPEDGTGQNREVMSSFDPLVVTLFDKHGAPIVGAPVSFTGPTTGPSASFRFGGVAETDDEGRAELRPYANQLAGTYTVWVQAQGANSMPFVLTNAAASPAKLLPVLGTDQVSAIGLPFQYPLTIEVRDNYGNRVEDAPVEFVAPMTGATTRMLDDGRAITDDEGRASVFAYAGDTSGTYTVLAKVTGAPSIPFVLSNAVTTGDQRATDLGKKATNELTMSNELAP